jgi:hypothetical protein
VVRGADDGSDGRCRVPRTVWRGGWVLVLNGVCVLGAVNEALAQSPCSTADVESSGTKDAGRNCVGVNDATASWVGFSTIRDVHSEGVDVAVHAGVR